MGDKKSQILAREIVARLVAGHAVGEELYRRLFVVLSDMFVEGTTDDGSFAMLLHDVRAAYRYDGASKLEGFDIGACWAAMSLMDSCESYADRVSMWRECVAKASRYRALLEALEKMPGAKQRDIAEVLGCGASNISQRLARLEPYKLFVVSVEGKSKRYYLTPKGERALETVRTREDVASAEIKRMLVNAVLVEEIDTGNKAVVRFDPRPELEVPTIGVAVTNENRLKELPSHGGRRHAKQAIGQGGLLNNAFSKRKPVYEY